MPGDATARNSKQLFLSGNSNTLPKLFWNEEEDEPLCFFLPVLKLQLSCFIGEKHCFYQQVPGPRFRKLLLGIWGHFHGLDCACISPYHPDPVLQATLVCFLSDLLIPEPDILVASTLNVSQGSESDF